VAKVTVGIPVYNGEAQLAECLDCVLRQTLQDIEVIIGDNVSSDRTAEIALDYAKRDSRVRYIRREINSGPMPNFIALTKEASSPYFIWRAHDDISSDDLLERLYVAITGGQGADLAIPTVRTTEVYGPRIRIASPDIFARDPDIIAIPKLMFRSHAGWYYGMWKTEVVRKWVQRVWDVFPHAWASDHLALYPVLLSRSIASAPAAVFEQRITPKSYAPKRGDRAPLRRMVQMRREFLAACNLFLSERDLPSDVARVIRALNWFYTGKRVYKSTKLLRRFVRENLGISRR